MEVVRYIHNNPVRAGITKNRRDYFYSSYKEYFDENSEMIDKDFILSIIDKTEFDDFHNTSDDVHTSEGKSDNDARDFILENYHIRAIDIKGLEKKHKKEIILQLKSLFSCRQLERVTGISRKTIAKYADE